MNLILLQLTQLFVAIFASKTISRVCYEGQQPGRNSDGKEYRWYLTGNPTDCTAIQVGGLNTRRHQIRPLEVRIGENLDLQHLEGVATEEAEESSSTEMTSYDKISSCAVTTNTSQAVWYPTDSHFSQPLERLEFTVLTWGPVTSYVYLYRSNGRWVYRVGLGRGLSTISRKDLPGNLCETEGVEFPGVFWLTYNSGEIQVGKDGNDTALLHCQDDSFSDDVWRIRLHSNGPAEWLFVLPYEELAPCPRSE